MEAIKILLVSLTLTISGVSMSQGCCSGGGGSPLAGGAVTGVLDEGQVEILSSYKYANSNRFLSGDSDTISFFDRLSSNYLFFKADYGITKRLTMSVSTGYYLNRTIFEFPDTVYTGSEMEISQTRVQSSGMSDLILFPRFNVFDSENKGCHSELSLGIGAKIPLGICNDSTLVGYSKFINWDNNPPSIDSTEIWQINPPTVQTTTGSNDFMLYAFYLRKYPKKNFRVFMNATYVRKGWNSLGIKFGDYATMGLFAGTTIFDNLNLLGQIKAEWVGTMQVHDQLNVLAMYNIDRRSTGSRMVSFVPQVNYNFAKSGISLFATADIPLYQYMNGTQIGSGYTFTGGISYRFYAKKKKEEPVVETGDPVVYHEDDFKVWGNCGMCKDKIEATLRSISGVTVAIWDQTTHMLHVRYNSLQVELDDLKIALAEVGYDTETHKATEKAYKKLHSCCQYEREL